MLALLLSTSAIAFSPRNDLFRCDSDGSVWNVTGGKRIAAGLDRPAGLVFVGERLFVLQRQELTELIDLDKDGVSDTYSCLCAAWKVSNDPQEAAHGLAFADGWLTTTLGSGERIRIAIADGHQEAAPAAGAELPLAIPAGFGPYSGRTPEAAGSARLGFEGLVEFARTGKAVFDLVDVHARSNGFELEFSEPLAEGFGWDPALWSADPLEVLGASVSPDRKHVELEIAGLANGQQVRLRSLGPVPSEKGIAAWDREATYSIRELPKDKREIENGWKVLFDGKSTSEWRGYKQKEMPAKGWSVENGILENHGGGGDLVSREEYADFELALEWKIPEGSNSGIFFRASEDHDYVWESAPEMQILDDAHHPDGRNPKTSAGSNYALIAPPPDVTRPVGCWNEVRLLVRGSHVEHWMNGVKLLEYELWSPEWRALVAGSKFAKMPGYGLNKTGRLALQDHGDPVSFRDIRIRPLVR
jgi:hypothetical protein